MGAENRSFTLLTTTLMLNVEPTVGATMGGSKRTVGGLVGFDAAVLLGPVAAFDADGEVGFKVTAVFAADAWPVAGGGAGAADIGAGDCVAAPPLPGVAGARFPELPPAGFCPGFKWSSS